MQQDGWKTQDGRMTKTCRVRSGMHSFRHSAVLSLPAVLLRKLATDRSQTERSGSIEVKSDGRDISSKYLDIFMTRRNAFIRIRSLPNLRNCSLYSFLLQREYRDGSRGGFRGYAAPHSPSPTHPEMVFIILFSKSAWQKCLLRVRANNGWGPTSTFDNAVTTVSHCFKCDRLFIQCHCQCLLLRLRGPIKGF